MQATDRIRGLLKTKRQSQVVVAPAVSQASRSGVLARIRSRREKLPRSDVAPGGALKDNDVDPQDPAPLGGSPSDHDTSTPPSFKEAAEPAIEPAAPIVVAAPKKRKNPYRSDRIRPIRILELLAKHFVGLTWAKWEPEALWHAIFDRYGTEPTREIKDMIGALRTLLTSEAFWREPHVFLWTCAALNRRIVDFRSYPELDPAEVIYAIAVVNRIRDHNPINAGGRIIEGVSFNPEVEGAIAAIFMHDGMVYVPPPTGDADRLLSERLDAAAVKLHDRVLEAWTRLGESDPIPKLSDDELGVQLSKLFAIREFVKGLERA